MLTGMKVGLLNNITPSEEQEWGSTQYQEFSDFFNQVEHSIDLVEYRTTEGQFPSSVDECEAYVLTGSVFGAYEDEPWIKQLISFVQEAYASKKTKLIGICFGHQLLAQALGGQVKKSEKGWGLGRRTFKLLESPSWMTPQVSEQAFYYAHQDQVESLPEDAILLTSDEFCQNGMFQLGANVLGMQGHPEFTGSKIKDVVSIVEPYTTQSVCSSAFESLKAGSADSDVVAQWFVNFLASPHEARA